MNWVCSFCGYENKTSRGKCMECNSGYRVRQGNAVKFSFEKPSDTRAEFFSTDKKIDWFSSMESSNNLNQNQGGVVITTPIKIASVFAFVCTVVGTLIWFL